MLSLEAALESSDLVRALTVDCRQLTQLPTEVLEFTDLESLRLNDCPSDFVVHNVAALGKLAKLDISGPSDGSLAFPEAFFECPITDLEIRKIRVREVAPFADRIKRFRLASYFIFEDILPLTKAFAGLEYLEVWGYHGKNAAGNVQHFELPPEIARLVNLEELEIVSAAMLDLPAELASLQNLRTVRLRNHHFASFPLALTRLPNLQDLEFSQNTRLTEITDEVYRMSSLRRLSFRGSWNEGALPLRFEEPELRPVPEEVGLFPCLTELNFDQCGVADIGPIAKIQTLEKLSLTWAATTELSPLLALSQLKDLNLKHAWVTDLGPLQHLGSLERLSVANTRVNDLSPLAHCSRLEFLDITDAKADHNPMRALEPLVELEFLDEIGSKSLKDRAWGDLRDNDALVAEDVARDLRSDDFETARAALQSVIDYGNDRSTQRVNALLAFFELDEDLMGEPENAEFEPFEVALSKHGRVLSSDLLADLVKATYVNTYDGWTATTLACELIITRNDLGAQNKVVQTFIDAMAYYDAGHRWYEDSLHDQFIEDLFPRFLGPALATLIPQLGHDHLNGEYGDGMESLFVPAFAGLSSPDEALVAALESYVMAQVEEAYGSDPLDADDLLVTVIEAAMGEVAEEVGRLRVRHQEAVALAKTKVDEVAPDAADPEESVEFSEPEADSVEAPTMTAREAHLRLEEAFEGEPDALIHTMSEIPRSKNKTIAASLAAYTNNKIIEFLKTGRVDEAVRLAKAYEEAAADIGPAEGNMRNNLASNTLVLAVYSGDQDIERLVFEKLMPPRISHTPLAFNVACFWAQKGQKDKMCSAMVEAIGLGKRPEHFLADSDFEAYLADPDFLAALEG